MQGPSVATNPRDKKVSVQMRYNIVVATHHKTGTVWMDGVFKAIAGDLGARYINFRDEKGHLREVTSDPFVLFCYDSDFGDDVSLLAREDVRIVHLVRDPRDVVISAMHYHKASRESWLHEPIPGYDNRTYQQALQQLPTRYAQYIFEMENSSASTLRDMARWRYGRANCFEARYETLRQDAGLTYWRRIMAFLGLDTAEQEVGSVRFWQNSLFGGLTRLGNRHIRSGAVAQWRREFTPDLGQAFLKRFPGLLQSLGYETSDAWVRELPRREEPGLLTGLRQLALDHLGVLAERSRIPSKF
jgi:Sulfotransferase domain